MLVNKFVYKQPRDKQRFNSVSQYNRIGHNGIFRPDPYHKQKMAESERAKSLKQDADRLTELRRFL